MIGCQGDVKLIEHRAVVPTHSVNCPHVAIHDSTSNILQRHL